MKAFINDALFSLLFFGILLLFAIQCAKKSDLDDTDPHRIVERTEFPVFKGETEQEGFYLPVVFHILEDGTVGNVNMMATSGDREWDGIAIDSMMKWKFISPPADQQGVMVRKNIRVVLLPSEVMNLGVLIARNESEANILHSRLRAGISFEQMVQQVSDNSNLGKAGLFMEDVDTIDFPTEVSKILNSLNEGSFTRPIPIDGDYLIFKRYGEHLPLKVTGY